MAENYGDKSSKTWLKVLLIVLAVAAAGGLGYYLGYNKGEADSQTKLEAQVSSLQQQVDAAKENVSENVEEGQEAVAEGQKSVQALQAENEQLKAKVADLEKQLEEAQSGTGTDTEQ